MHRPVVGLLVTLLFASLVSAGTEPKEVSFTAADGVEVYADLYRADAEADLVLLFHQAGGDARGEYEWIANRLVQVGFHVLAVDQRVGGDRFGGVNRTMAFLVSERELTYCDAYPDLLAALTWAEAEDLGNRRFAWGSSYSAALVVRLAAEHGDRLAGVLAFSPAGSRMGDCETSVFAPRVEIPVFAARPDGEVEVDSVREQLEDFAARGFRTFVAIGGVHGSSMLHPERAKGEVEAVWGAVLEFLAEP